MNRFTLFILTLGVIHSSTAQYLGSPSAVVSAMDVDPERHLIAAVVDRQKLQVWDYLEKKLITEHLLEHRACAIAIGKHDIMVCRTDGYVEVFASDTFDRRTVIKVSDHSLYEIKKKTAGEFVILDQKGNFYQSDTTLNFNKMGTTGGNFSAMCLIPEIDVLVIGSEGGVVSFYSITRGHLLTSMKTSGTVFALGSVPERNELVVATGKKLVTTYIFDRGLSTFQRRSAFLLPGLFPVALDARAKLQTAGNGKGRVRVYTEHDIYKWQLSAMVNFIYILPDQFPNIRLAVGTQGAGIRILSAIDTEVFSK